MTLETVYFRHMRDVLHQWDFLEYHAEARSTAWYIVAGAFSAALFVWAALTANYLFALIIALFVFIMFLHDARKPQTMRFAITAQGITLGFRDELESQRLIRWRDLESFWVLYEPPEVKNLYFHYKSFWSPHLAVPLGKEDPVKVRRTLKKYLEEDTSKEHEPFADLMRRVLKL